jgi:hypothetical protein
MSEMLTKQEEINESAEMRFLNATASYMRISHIRKKTMN